MECGLVGDKTMNDGGPSLLCHTLRRPTGCLRMILTSPGAVARPMPLVPPVINTVFPTSGPFSICSTFMLLRRISGRTTP